MTRISTCALAVLAAVAALAACDREPRLPAERAARVQEAREDVASARKKLARADEPGEVVSASRELSAASVEFATKRDAAVAATQRILEQTDGDIRSIVDVRAETEFQDPPERTRTDAAIRDLLSARAELEATLELMRIATAETWDPLAERVAPLSRRIRAARQTALDGLY